MAGIARQRLMEERKSFRKNRPFGFFARPCTLPDGTQDLMKWECGIPGKEGTLFAGAVFPLTMAFSEDYPLRPPKCQFPAGFFHPNIFPSGTVCLSILNEEGDWQPGISTQQILTGIQDLLDSPNPNDPAQEPAFKCYMEDRDAYHRRIKQQTAKYAATLQ